jgi:hypothetical protein
MVTELNFQCNLQNPRYKLQDAKSHKMLYPSPSHTPPKYFKEKEKLISPKMVVQK